MNETEKRLIEIYKGMLKIEPENEIDLNAEISRELGFDSLGMVDFVINIEESFDIELDKYLAEIRKAPNLSEIVRIVENAKQSS